MLSARRVLIVVAHPDDEILGCGGAVKRLSAGGVEVHACILSGTVSARTMRPVAPELHEDMNRAKDLLGIQKITLGEFENIHFNAVPHLRLVQFIEEAIRQTEPDVVFTHHPSDVNNDHVHTSLACQAAVRLPQRNHDLHPISALYYMEVASATDWAVPGGGVLFTPTTFVDIEGSMEAKLEAIRAYRNVLRPPPHPRSREVIEAMAVCRGAQAQLRYAEAFQLAYQRL